ncbi:hypothetical protein Tco_1215499 [Tanacetum coccineum]
MEETNTFDNSSPESETFCFDLEENSSGSTTTRSDYSLPDYEAFISMDDYIKRKVSGEMLSPDSGELTSIVDSGIRENVLSTTNVNLPFEDDQSLSGLWNERIPFLTPTSPFIILLCRVYLIEVELSRNSMIAPDYEDSHARGFVHRSLKLQSLA